MTEAEWLACDDREVLQNFLRHHPWAPRVRGFERRLRLYACGCCRLLWGTFPDDACRHAVVTAEAYADGQVGADALAEAHAAVRDLPVPAGAGWEEVWEEVDNPFGGGRVPTGPEWSALMAAFYVTDDPGERRYPAGETLGTAAAALHGPAEVVRAAAALGGGAETTRIVAVIFRDIFGNPFRPVTADPAWLTSTVVALAEGIYADRAFDRMPILADALQDAGCDSADVLDHSRGPGPHVRGCWVVDLVLGKA
jgi:hypothetical protein